MKTTYKILNLIDQGDIPGILADNVLFPRFHDLMDRDLLTMIDDKLVITEKGNRLRTSGGRCEPEGMIGDGRPNLVETGRRELRFLHRSSLFVIGSWLLVIMYILVYCLLLCSG